MRRSMAEKVVSVMMALMVPMTLMAAEVRGALLVPQGQVSVNGSPAQRSTALFAGDRVQTGPNAGGMITANGSSVQVAPQSAIIFDGNSVSLSSGGAAVKTSSGMKAKLSGLSVQPVEKGARYSLGQRNGKVVVAALQGKLRITDGRQELLLDPGKAMVTDAPKDEAGQAGGAGGAAGGAGGGLSTATIVVVTAAVVGASVGLAVGLTEASTPAASQAGP